jgi:MFS family permease
MFILFLIWLGLGLLIGALALAARLRPASWGRRGWLWMLGLGILAAQLGGWLGTLLMGRLYGTPDALWVAALLVVVVPLLAERWRARRQRVTQSHQPDRDTTKKEAA